MLVHPVTTNSYLVLDELLLPHMKKIDSMLNDNRKRLLLNLHLDQSFKVFPSHGLLANSVAIIVLNITGKNILEVILSFIKLSTQQKFDFYSLSVLYERLFILLSTFLMFIICFSLLKFIFQVFMFIFCCLVAKLCLTLLRLHRL